MIITGIVLDSGKSVISNSLVGLATSFASGFQVADQFGFPVDETDTAPRGNIVYNGPSQDIAVTRVAIDTVRFVCTIPEGVGPINMGNLVLYMQDQQSNVVPFISVAFPQRIVKTPSADQVTTDGFILPGSRFSISIEIKHSNNVNTVTITILPPDYSSLPTFATEAEMPPAASMTFKQAVVNFDTRSKTPVMYSIDHNNVRWGNPFYQQIRDPDFGQLDGGMDGEGWGGEAEEIIFGYFYTTADGDFTANPVGGAAYTDIDANLQTVGGATYTVTVNQGLDNI